MIDTSDHQVTRDNLTKYSNMLKEKAAGLLMHSVYTSMVVKDLAVSLELDPSTVGTLQIAALLHDIGKVDTPLQILLKGTELTKEEFELIKQHPDRGADMLTDSNVFTGIAPLVRFHHELPNGGGYPTALPTTYMCQHLNILAVADKFAAWTEHRCYREPLSAHGAIDNIYDYICGFFGNDASRVVATLLSLYSESYHIAAYKATSGDTEGMVHDMIKAMP